tara:strand:+ start:2685 stop:2945 length:261 start_codon:yes stop_codon:yes gene_type:complete
MKNYENHLTNLTILPKSVFIKSIEGFWLGNSWQHWQDASYQELKHGNMISLYQMIISDFNSTFCPIWQLGNLVGYFSVNFKKEPVL